MLFIIQFYSNPRGISTVLQSNRFDEIPILAQLEMTNNVDFRARNQDGTLPASGERLGFLAESKFCPDEENNRSEQDNAELEE
jgi:hypothetical protein